jgi:hypothetical protein
MALGGAKTMTDRNSNATMPTEAMPDEVAAIVERGYATWAGDGVDPVLRARFKATRIPVVSVRHVRVWGLQVDDERELPGHERTQIPDEDIWEVNLLAIDGSKFEVDSRLLKPAK